MLKFDDLLQGFKFEFDLSIEVVCFVIMRLIIEHSILKLKVHMKQKSLQKVPALFSQNLFPLT